MTNPPISLTNKVHTTGARIAAMGDADQLKAAYEAGEQVTLGGKLAGERVYLGYRRQTFDLDSDGVTVETIGLDRMFGESPKYPGHIIASYCVDLTRLDDAPTLAALAAKDRNLVAARAAAAEARAQEEDERLSREAD